MVSMANRLSPEKQKQIVASLVEGNSIRATARMVGCSKNTVTKLLSDLGLACAKYQDEALRDLPCKRLQVDEIWSFVYAKQKNVPAEKKGQFGYGDVWTFTAICADTKLVPCWLIGSRDGGVATEFMRDLSSRLSRRVQLTTDGHAMYLEAVADGFDGWIDFAQLIKIYGPDPEPEKRYSPAKCKGTRVGVIDGDPDPAHVSTSYVERQNLTMRMSMRRFTRLTNAFSKKVEKHAAAIALHFMHYNFCRPHRSLRTKKNNRITPAMAAGVTERPWTIQEVLDLLPKTKHRGGRPAKTN